MTNLIARIESADGLVEELSKLAAKSSPGPWHLVSGAIGVNPWIASSNGTLGDGTYARGGCILNMVAHDQNHDDAALIIFLRNNLDTIRQTLAAAAALKARGVCDGQV